MVDQEPVEGDVRDPGGVFRRWRAVLGGKPPGAALLAHLESRPAVAGLLPEHASKGAGDSHGADGDAGAAGAGDNDGSGAARGAPKRTASTGSAAAAGVVVHNNVLLDSIAARQRLINRLQAENTADLDELARHYVGLREFLEMEIAGALNLSEAVVATQVGIAEQLRKLPLVAAAWHAGDLDLPKVRYLAEHTAHLDTATAHQLEQRILPAAVGLRMPAFRRHVRRALLALSPDEPSWFSRRVGF